MLAKVLIDLFCVIFRLTFQFSPSSKVYGFSEVDLTPNGGDKVLLPHLTRIQCLSLLVKHLPFKSPYQPSFSLHYSVYISYATTWTTSCPLFFSGVAKRAKRVNAREDCLPRGDVAYAGRKRTLARARVFRCLY